MSNKITKNELHEDIVQVLDNSVIHEAEKATDTTLGHVKVDGVSITADANGTISVNRSNVFLDANRLLSMGGML